MARHSLLKNDMLESAPRSTANMLESILGSQQAYVRAHTDQSGQRYYALTSVQGEMLATFAEKADALHAMTECKLLPVSVH